MPELPGLLEKAQDRVLDWAMFMCGFIPDKEDSMIGEIVIEDDYLNQIKEDRLIKMLTCEAFETDERWLIYDDEEVEVQTEVSELVFDYLLEEVISDLANIKSGKKIKKFKSVSIAKFSEKRLPTDSSMQHLEDMSNHMEEIVIDADFGYRGENIEGFNQGHSNRSGKSFKSQSQRKSSKESGSALTNRSRFSNHGYDENKHGAALMKNKSDLVPKISFKSDYRELKQKTGSLDDKKFTEIVDAAEEIDKNMDKKENIQIEKIDSPDPQLSPNLEHTPEKDDLDIDKIENFEDLKHEDYSNMKNDREKVMQNSSSNISKNSLSNKFSSNSRKNFHLAQNLNSNQSSMLKEGNFNGDDSELYEQQLTIANTSKGSTHRIISNIDDFGSKNSLDSESKHLEDEENHLNLSKEEDPIKIETLGIGNQSVPNLMMKHQNTEVSGKKATTGRNLGSLLAEKLEESHFNSVKETVKKVNNDVFLQAIGNIEAPEKGSKSSSELGEVVEAKQDADDVDDLEFLDDDFGSIDDDPFASSQSNKDQKKEDPFGDYSDFDDVKNAQDTGRSSVKELSGLNSQDDFDGLDDFDDLDFD